MLTPDSLPELGRQSARLREVRELKRASERRSGGVFLIEGPRLFERLLDLLSGPEPPSYRLRFFLVSEPYLERFHERGYASICTKLGTVGARVGERAMSTISDTRTPPGVVAVIERPVEATDLTELALARAAKPTARLLLAYGISDPGNLGTLARAAAGLGADAFLAADGADPFGPKVLRATAGDFLSLPYGEIAEPDAFLRKLGELGVVRVAAVPRGGQPPATLGAPSRWVLVLGSESHGLPESWMRDVDERVTIPLERSVESLNVAVAGSILLHALCRPA